MHIVLEVSGFYFIIRNGNSVHIRGRNPLAKVLLVIEHLTLALVPRGLAPCGAMLLYCVQGVFRIE